MKFIILSIILLIAFITPSYGYWGNTHQRIARTSVKEREILLDENIKKIGFNSGVLEIFASRDVRYIIEGGSETEDNGIRFRNHFYNPLDGSGLADVFIGSSSYEWADQINSGWSWRNSRLSFYRGMTATSEVERRSALADSFRALGQVMHLVQDTAVPAHVRNDLHMIPDGYEAFASKNVDSLYFVPIAFSGQKSSISTYSPRQLWDSDQYDGTNPPTSTTIGLAEYTNANFASEDTIFTENTLDDWSPLNNNHYFPYPRQADMVVVDENQNRIGMNGYVIYRKYFEKIGGGQIIRHFATASRLYEHLLDDPEPSIQGFDDQCYKDYADLLIPRAVGYSAALLDYFFRGQIDMVADSSQYVIKNESDEAMSGTFSLYYDDTSGIRQLVPAADWYLSIAAKGASSPVTFTAPSDAKEPGKYMLVFLGKHGAESGAVVGKSIELKNDLDIRIVTVSNYVSQWEDRRGQIKVFTNKGIIYGQIPKEIFAYSIEKVKFDKSNKNRIAIFTFDKYFTRKIYTFKVDEINKSINYEKTVYEENYIPYSYSYEIINEDFDNSYIDPVKGICNYVYRNVKITHTNSWKNIIDFYFDNEYIKLFYSDTSYINEYLAQNSEDCCGGDDGCLVDDFDNYYYIAKIYMDETTDIYYGDNKVASVEHLCTGGWFSSDGYDYNECTNGSNADKYYYPMAIFNKNDYAYGINNGGLLVDVETSLPYDLSQYIVNGTIGLNHLVLKDDSYGFNLTTGARGSFSSSLGSLACGGLLVTDIQAEGGYVTKTWGGFSVFRSCNDYTIINAPAYYIDSKDVFDVYVK